MNEVLLRPIFRAKYIEEQKKNKFNKGGLASIQKFAEGGLSKGERTAITLAPFVQALTGAQTLPGESEASSFARAFGQGLGGLGEAKKSIAAIDQASAPKEQFRILSNEEVASGAYGPLTPGGVYQLNVASKEIKDLTPRKLFADPFETEYVKESVTEIKDIQKAGAQALTNRNNLEIIKAAVSNPDLTLGQFGNLAAGATRLAEGLGFGNVNFSDITAAELLQKFSGQKVLSDLSNFKGAISDKDLEFIKSLGIEVGTTREAAMLLIDLYAKANDIATAKAEAVNNHIANFGSPLNKDQTGKTLDQKIMDINANMPFLTPEIEARLQGAGKPVGTKFARNILVVNEQTLNQYKQLFPDKEIKVGDKFEVRQEKLRGKQVKTKLIPIK